MDLFSIRGKFHKALNNKKFVEEIDVYTNQEIRIIEKNNIQKNKEKKDKIKIRFIKNPNKTKSSISIPLQDLL